MNDLMVWHGVSHPGHLHTPCPYSLSDVTSSVSGVGAREILSCFREGSAPAAEKEREET